ncbi:MAG: glycosyltransferase [Erysipelotrichaceae bacterium]|nr:glycosyltransferase [Erysipelotrichaceae bacterium]
MNNVALLMGLYPKAIYNKIVEDSITMPQYAADALQKSFVVGISKKVNTTVINLPYVGSFPKRYRSLFVPEVNCNELGAEIRSSRYCNFTYIKNFCRISTAFKALKAWTSENPQNRTIVIYAIHLPFLSAVAKLKKEVPNIKLIQIVPDLPEFMNSNPSRIRTLAYKKTSNYYHIIDGWILLSKYMVGKLNITNKPWQVIEGIYNPMDTPVEASDVKSESTFRIFYGGTLARRYGIMNLVNAVSNSSNKRLELVLCGGGETSEEIIKLSETDSRIKLLGSVPRQEVLKQIRCANLLVNPRTNEGEFTKYSFPSKTMEYLSSGIPTLLYRLPGIPEEYYNYCFSLEKIGIDVLKAEIERIALLPKSKLQEMGAKAKRFILNSKNPEAQCEKLIKLIAEIESDNS